MAISISPSRTTTTLLYIVGGPVLFLVAVVFFAYWTFPFERIARYAEQNAPEGWVLEIGDIGPAFPFGVAMENVRVARPPLGENRPITLTLDEVTAKVSLLGLLRGRKILSIDAEAGGGTVEGTISQIDDHARIELALADVNLTQAPLLGFAANFPISGVASGTVDLVVGGAPADQDGHIDLRVTQMAIGDARSQIPVPGMNGGFALERINAGDLRIQMDVQDGSGRITALEARGRDLELRVTGGFRLGRTRANATGAPTERIEESLASTTVDLLVSIKVADEYKRRTPATEGLFTALSFRPEITAAKRPDGALQWRLSGNVRAIQYFPAGSVAPPAAR